MIALSSATKAQSGLCDANTPFYVVDLSAQANSSFVTPQDRRLGNCCATSSPDRCVEFEITLHPNALGISFDIYSGAVPTGAMFYQINCGPAIPVGQAVCLSGVGPHTVTFCKPGNNPNAYIIRSIPPPYQAPDNEVRVGCSIELATNGLIPNTISWSDITSGTGAYNSYLSCVSGCSITYFSPQPGAPAYVDYEVCGAIFDTICNGNFTVCDTLRVFVYPELQVPDLDTIYYCITNGGVTLQGTAYGGFGTYEYYWFDSVGNVLGNGSSYFAATPGIYQLEIRDDLYPACPADRQNIHVLPDLPASVYAGLDTIICSATPSVSLSGTFQNVIGASWTGGNGSFQQSRDSINNTYSPSAGEVTALSVILTLTSRADTACPVATDQKVIQFRTPPVVTIAGYQDITCNGANDGFINVNTTGGTTPYSFQWSNGSGTEDISNLDTGYYQLIATDGLGCTDSISQTIQQPTPLIAAISVVNVSCFGGNNGAITTTVSGGNPPYSYTWNNGTSTVSQNGLLAGAYSVTISDASGCNTILDTTITEPLPLILAVANASNLTCFGSNDGSITLSISGGITPYTYLWSNGANTQNISGLTPSTYTVTATDANGCSQTVSATITEPLILQSVLTVSNATCFGLANGSIDLDPRGGTAPYTYTWSNGANTQDINSLTAGLYELTLTDANGCSLTNSRYINEPAQLIASGAPTNINCFGNNNGAIDLTVSGGTAPYTYQWSTGSATQDISTLIAGTYKVTVSDINSCRQTLSFTLSQPSEIVLAYTATPASCNGVNNGSVDLTVSGGTGPYSYNWATGANTQDINTIPAGSYPVTVTDATGCSIDTVALVVEPNAIMLQATTTRNVLCYGGTDGTITLNVSGGSGTYTYVWSNGANAQNISNLAAGNYQVTVNDVNNCRSLASATIQQPAQLVASTTPTDITCHDANDGAINLQVSGGTTAYNYAWSNGKATEDLIALAGGTYTVTITDINGCSITAADSIYNPDIIDQQPYISHVSCFGGANGFIEVNPIGGYGPYAFAWQQGGNLPFVFNVGAGNYSVTITDASGCASVAQYTVLQPDSIDLLGTVNNVSCFGSGNGSISLNAIGGTQPYSYNWSTGSNTSGVAALVAGNYHVTVTDISGCTQMASFNITQPDSMRIQANIANVSCNGGSNGSISTTTFGGTPPYTYLWSNGRITANINGLLVGSYTLSTTDAKGCETSAVYQIAQPQPLTLSLQKEDILCQGNNNGRINTIVTGGNAPYTYAWSNGSNASNILNQSPGSYRVTVTDAKGCTINGQQTINEPTQLTLTATVANLSCYQSADGVIDVSVAGGTAPYTYNWLSGPTTQDLTNLSIGDYYLTVTDANGCKIYYNTTITQPTEILLNAVSQDASCNGIANGSIDLNANGGSPSYTYLWSTNDVSQDLGSIPAAVYSVTVTDATGCEALLTVPVSEPSSLQVSASTVNNVSCNGGNDGAIDLTITGSVAVSQISWSNGSNNQNISQLQAGDYYVTVADANGCRSIDIATVTEPDPLNIIPTINNASCFGYSNGSISIAVSGGAMPYQYNWVGGGSGTQNTNLAAGSYTVIVTDSSTCSTTLNYVIEEPNALRLTATTLSNVSCYGGNNGSVTVLVSGGSMPYRYLWSNGSTDSINNNLSLGIYTVTVNDANGCNNNVSSAVSQPDSISLTTTKTDVTCYGGNQGSIEAIVNGGTQPYRYLWSNGDTTAVIQNLSIGTYTVTITDANGCNKIISNTITQPDSINHQFTVDNVSCYNGNDGSIATTLSGGTAPFNLTWANGSNHALLINLAVGNYTLTVTDANGCVHIADTSIAQPDSMQMTVATQNITCYGANNGTASISITGGSGTYTYLWSNGAATSSISGLAPGTYTYQISDGAGCLINGSANITQPDSVIASTQGTPWICQGTATGEITASVLGGSLPYTYAWSNGAIDSSITNLPFGNYTVTVTDANGCITTADFTIQEIINQLNPSVTTACVNHNIDFEGTTNADSAVVSWQWHFGDGTSANTQYASHAFATAGNTTVVLIVESNTGCKDTTTAPITIIPAPTADAGPSQTICVGDVTTLIANGGIDYQWSPAITLTAPNSNITDAKPAQDQWYNVTVTDANGCSSIDSALVTVNTPPVVDLGPDYSICTGDTTLLFATGGTSYLWTGNTGSMYCTQCPVNIVYPVQTETYTVQVTNAAGCVSYDSIVISVLSLPGGITNNSSSICQLTTAELSGPSGNGYQYEWSPSDLIDDPYSQFAVVESLDSTTLFQLTTIDTNGCRAIDTSTVNVLAVPRNFLPDTAAICQGDTITLNAPQQLTGHWNGPAGTMSCNFCGSTNVYPMQSSNYTASAFAINGCEGRDTVTVLVSVPSQPNLGDALSFCEGMELTIPATIYGGATYQWSPATGLNNATVAQPTVTLTNDQMYFVTITDTNGCVTTDSMQYILRDGSAISLNTDTTVCVGEMVTLYANMPYEMAGNTTYQWYDEDGYTVSNQNPIEVQVNVDASYTLIIDNEGCKPDTLTSNLSINPTPSVDINALSFARESDSMTIVANSSLSNLFEWSTGIDSCVGCSSILVEAIEGTSYSVTVTNEFGCKAEANTTIRTFCDAEIFIPNSFSPNRDGVNDVFKARSIADIQIITFRIFDRWGNLVFEGSNDNAEWNGTYHGALAEPGVYVYYMEVKCPAGQVNFMKGNITMLR